MISTFKQVLSIMCRKTSNDFNFQTGFVNHVQKNIKILKINDARCKPITYLNSPLIIEASHIDFSYQKCHLHEVTKSSFTFFCTIFLIFYSGKNHIINFLKTCKRKIKKLFKICKVMLISKI